MHLKISSIEKQESLDEAFDLMEKKMMVQEVVPHHGEHENNYHPLSPVTSTPKMYP